MIPQPGPLSSQRLGNQKVIGLLIRQRRRVELHVLRVHDPRTGAPGHDHAVANRVAGVRAVQKNLADAAGGQDRGVRKNRIDVVRAIVQQVDADAFVVQPITNLNVGRMMLRRQQVDGRHLRRQGDVRLALDAIEQRRLDRPAGCVAGVNDSRNRMRPLLRQIELPLFARGEGDVNLFQQQLADDARAFDGQKAHCLFAREAGTGADDVFDQLRRRVVLALVDNPALRPERVAVFRIRRLRHQQDFDSCTGKAKRGC